MTLFVSNALASSYNIVLPAGANKWTCGAFQFTNDVISHVFTSGLGNGTDYMTTVAVWNDIDQTYNTLVYGSIFGGWSNPNYVLNRGATFLIKTTSANSITFTISGTTPTDDYWYLVDYRVTFASVAAKTPIGGYLDLACPNTGFQILHYDLTDGDQVSKWNYANQSWDVWTRNSSGWNSGLGPSFAVGEGGLINISDSQISESLRYLPSGSTQTCP